MQSIVGVWLVVAEGRMVGTDRWRVCVVVVGVEVDGKVLF